MTYVQKTRNVLQNIKKNKSPQSPKTIQLIQKLLRSFHNHWMEQFRSLRNSKSFGVFKGSILKFIRSSPSSIFNRDNCKGKIRLITRLRVGLNHLSEHKFRHSFQNWLHPI